MTSLSTNLVASKNRTPDRVALRCDDLQFTFAEFDAGAARVATLLEQAGVEPGDRVGVMLPNTPGIRPRVLRDHVPRRRRGPDEPAAQGPRGGLSTCPTAAPRRCSRLLPSPTRPCRAPNEMDAQCWVVDDAGLANLIVDLPEQGVPGANATTMTPPSSCTPQAPPASPRAPMLTHGNLGRNVEVSVRDRWSRPGRTTW